MASITKYTNTKGTFYRATIYVGIDPDTGKQINKTKRGFKTKNNSTSPFSHTKNKPIYQQTR